MATPGVLDNVRKCMNELDELHALSERLSSIALRATSESDAAIMQYREVLTKFLTLAPLHDSSETTATHALRLMQEKLDTAIRAADQYTMLIDIVRQRATRAERDYAQLARTVETISKQFHHPGCESVATELRKIAAVAMSKVHVAPFAVDGDEDRDEPSPTYDDMHKMLVVDDTTESATHV